MWADNARATYTNWFNGQPDDAARRGSCVKASMNQGYRGFLTWSDDDCATLNSFVCKKLKGTYQYWKCSPLKSFMQFSLSLLCLRKTAISNLNY